MYINVFIVIVIVVMHIAQESILWRNCTFVFMFVCSLFYLKL